MSLRPDLARLQRKLDDMPDRAVVVDQRGDAWQKSGYLGFWYRAFDGDGVDSFALAQRARKAKEQQPEQIAESARRCWGCGHEHQCSTAFVAEEPEWEYGIRADGDDEPYTDHSDDPDWLCDQITPEPGDAIVRRRKAGPWVPVKQEGEQQ